jgi:hypothetical protein
LTGIVNVFQGNATTTLVTGLDQAANVTATMSPNDPCDDGESVEGFNVVHTNGTTSLCTFHFTNPGAYMYVNWDRVTGGGLSGASGLTVRVYGRAL